MSRTDLFDRRVEDLRDETRKLIDWAHGNAAYYKKNAPLLVDDIQGFENCAATLDAFQAGLAVVPPHRAMHMELVRWVRVTQELPDADETVLIMSGSEGVALGYLDGDTWRAAEGWPLAPGIVQFWAALPTGPQMHDALTEEAAA